MNLADLQEIILELAGSRAQNARPRRLSPLVAQLQETGRTSNGQRLHADEIRGLKVLATEIDGEPSAERAWELVSDVARTEAIKKPADSDEIHRGLADNVQKATVAYFDHYSKEVASGVLVDILGRVFVSTVAHALPTRPQGRIAFISFERAHIRETTPELLSFGKVKSERPDVGFLELQPEFVANALRKTPIMLTRIGCHGAATASEMIYLLGFPTGLIKQVRDSKSEATLTFQAQCFGNIPVMPDHWEHIEKSDDPVYHPDPAMDIFVPYPMEEEIVSLGAKTSPDLPDPYGLSGGGWWQAPEKQSLWTPEHYKLIGIQSMWPKKGRYLQATQILHWLRLLRQHLADLQEVIDFRFPGANFAEQFD